MDNSELINTLEGWEELFLKVGESEIIEDNVSMIDYTFTPYIVELLKQGRQAIDKARKS